MTATQTMEVVHGLFKNMKVVMDGTERSLDISFSVLNVYLRWKGIDRQYPGGSGYDSLRSIHEYS